MRAEASSANQPINHQYPCSDECRGMDTVLDDTAVIQQNAGEHGYLRRIAQSSIKNRQESISSKKSPSPCWLCGGMHYCRHCTYNFMNSGASFLRQSQSRPSSFETNTQDDPHCPSTKGPRWKRELVMRSSRHPTSTASELAARHVDYKTSCADDRFSRSLYIPFTFFNIPFFTPTLSLSLTNPILNCWRSINSSLPSTQPYESLGQWVTTVNRKLLLLAPTKFSFLLR
ncbi:hypothetical protein ACTXT7_013847 [Hymenolepis weldensis]